MVYSTTNLFDALGYHLEMYRNGAVSLVYDHNGYIISRYNENVYGTNGEALLRGIVSFENETTDYFA